MPEALSQGIDDYQLIAQTVEHSISEMLKPFKLTATTDESDGGNGPQRPAFANATAGKRFA